ncbi:LuxR family transcriptional regulator [Kitasatospora sp. NBC_01287]|uniref:LuxR family transcriptional regulator n=1 Tax=Kitasatospora sp. NBC_01287 TaxID=2903573 RepID=UPI0022556E89|nr:LuxR family transcriptional regulator [Kitasatospora sp. NBC_01287]MCX4747558.1 LuxR family transcriptional regulator [Kitasatospora sp. NBC_01287]
MSERQPTPVVPDAVARALYLRLLAEGGVFRFADVAASDPGPLEQLVAAGLVAQQMEDRFWAVLDPRSATDALSSGLRAAGIGLLLRAEESSAVLAGLAGAYESASRARDAEGAIQQVEDIRQTQRRIIQLTQECTREILMMQPGGARPAEYLPRMRAAAREMTDRGIAQRTIYQPGARTDRGTVGYAAYATRLGARIRLLDEPFRRTLVFDRRVAVVDGFGGYQAASFIEDPVLVELVVHSFERDWARAERVRWEEPVAEAGDGQLVALLARGLTQRGIATRLRLSERTVAAQISRLRERYEARTLFQLGWQMRGTADD